MNTYRTTQELQTAFGDISSKSFYEPVALRDTEIGFSVKKDYPPDIRYKPAVRQDSDKPDNVAVIWVVALGKQTALQQQNQDLLPLRIRVATMSLYRAKHWDYDFGDTDGGCPSKESLEASLATPQPHDLTFENDYFYDTRRKVFVDAKGRTFSGGEVLQEVFDIHCDTVHPFRGLKLRLKLAWQAGGIGLLGLLIQLQISLLKHAFGRTIESSETMAGLYKPYKREALKKLNQDSVELLGYKASKPVVIWFCLLVIFVSYYRYTNDSSFGYVAWLEGKEFVSVAHGIFVVWLIDVVVPMAVFRLINGMVRLKAKMIFWKISAK